MKIQRSARACVRRLHRVAPLWLAALAVTWGCAAEPFTPEEFHALSPPVVIDGGLVVGRQVTDAGHATPKDAGTPCGNGICGPGEDCTNCKDDCKCGDGEACKFGTCVPDANCGDHICGPGENCGTCQTDCLCGDGTTCNAAGSCSCASNFCQDGGHGPGNICDDGYSITCAVDGICKTVSAKAWCPKGCTGSGCAKCTCLPGEKKCDGPDLLTCAESCTAWTSQTCADGCLGNACVKCACTAGSTKCEGNVQSTCKDDCSGWKTSTCQYGCAGNKCVDCACVAGANTCTGQTLSTCKADCSGWKTSTCKYGCANNNNKCIDCGCVAGETTCTGQTLSTCKADCSGLKFSSCEYGCSGNKCKICSCTPGATCAGSDLITCSANCNSVSSTQCKYGCKNGGCLSAAQCSSGDCCDAQSGYYLKQSTKCGSAVQAKKYKCIGNTVHRQQAYQGCSGSMSNCSTSSSNYYWSGWSEFQTCGSGTSCEASNGSYSCKKLAPLGASCTYGSDCADNVCIDYSSGARCGKYCTSDSTCGSSSCCGVNLTSGKKSCAAPQLYSNYCGQCTSGDCCNVATKSYESKGTKCGTSIKKSEYSCVGTTAYKKSAYYGCPGSSETCSSSSSNYYWSSLQKVTSCTSGKKCVLTSSSYQCVLQPAVSVSPSVGYVGTVFKQNGSGFTPKGKASLVFTKPDNVQYPAFDVAVDSFGNYINTYKVSSSNLKGQYTYWAIDKTTGTKTKSVYYVIK